MTLTSQQRELDRLIALILCGRHCDWTGPWSEVAIDAFFGRTSSHGVTALVDYRLRTGPAGVGCPSELLTEARDRAVQLAAREAMVAAELRRVLSALEQLGVRPVIIKGTALAYTTYEQAYLRERCDTDLLVRPDDFEAVEKALEALGYSRHLGLGDGATTPQAWFECRNRFVTHALDVHWHISNRPLLRNVVSHDELVDRAKPAPRLHRWAIVPCDLDALLLAAVHRVAHHNNAVDVGWLYDIHLLARRLGAGGLKEVRDSAEKKHVSALCANAIEVTLDAFGGEVLPRKWLDLWTADAKERREPSALYLTSIPWIGDQALSDFLTLPGWHARARFLGEILVPDTRYMLARYGATHKALLPLLHARRLSVGMWNLAGRLATDLAQRRSPSVAS